MDGTAGSSAFQLAGECRASELPHNIDDDFFQGETGLV